jgi:TPR repeat protein
MKKCNILIRYNGQGVTQDKHAALLLFRDAAAAGDAQALFNCGAIEFASIHAAHDNPSRDMLHDVANCLKVGAPTPSPLRHAPKSFLHSPFSALFLIPPQAAADLGHAAAQAFTTALSTALPPPASACASIATDCTVFVVTGGWHR